MKICYSWLCELTGLDWSAEEMAERLTLCGASCEDIEPAGRYMDKVSVGVVTGLKPMEGTGKLQLATVDIGSSSLELVCGAPNVAVGQKVPVAISGAVLAGGTEIRTVTIRGVESSGMICSERELGITDDHTGIMVLDSDARPGQPLVEYLAFDDYSLTFEITPNRPDSLSAIGLARDLAALAVTGIRRPVLDLKESRTPASERIQIEIDDPEGCPRYMGRVICGVRVGSSPWWLQKRLLLSGIRPVSNVVDVTNYVMLETGHPLHAFDLARFGSDRVGVRRAEAGETFITLDGKEHVLTPDVLLITNGREAVAAGGVMGGLESEVTQTTSDLLLEAAYFDPTTIRRSRRHLGLVTESSYRFERGADPNGIPWAIDRAAGLLQQLCGGEVLGGAVDCYPRTIEPKVVALRPARCRSVLGCDLPTKRIREILEHLEYGVSGGESLEVMVPTFRVDIDREIDLIEEVARIIGWGNIPNAVSNIGPLYTPIHPEDRFTEEVRHLLTGSGYDEMLWHGLIDAKRAERFHPDCPPVQLSNPSSEDLNAMRRSLAESALMVVSHNLAHRNMDLMLFETGTVYRRSDAGNDVGEHPRLMLLVTGQSDRTWRRSPRQLDFYDLSGAIAGLAEHFHWEGIEYREAPVGHLSSDMSYHVYCNGRLVGEIGSVDPDVLKSFGIKQPVYMAELDMTTLVGLSRPLASCAPLPSFPAAPRDIAFVVDDSVRAGDLTRRIKETAGGLAESVGIFDLYTGKQIDQGKKSIAITIVYRSPSRSLSSDEVDEHQRKVTRMLESEFNAVIREK